MLSIAPPPTIYLHTGTTDMRKSFDGLSGIIRGTFSADPSDGSLFLFVNKRRDRIKALWWDGDGYVLWYKRLEEETFETMPPRNGEERVRIDSTQLAMILGGARLESVRRRKRMQRANCLKSLLVWQTLIFCVQMILLLPRLNHFA